MANAVKSPMQKGTRRDAVRADDVQRRRRSAACAVADTRHPHGADPTNGRRAFRASAWPTPPQCANERWNPIGPAAPQASVAESLEQAARAGCWTRASRVHPGDFAGCTCAMREPIPRSPCNWPRSFWPRGVWRHRAVHVPAGWKSADRQSRSATRLSPTCPSWAIRPTTPPARRKPCGYIRADCGATHRAAACREAIRPGDDTTVRRPPGQRHHRRRRRLARRRRRPGSFAQRVVTRRGPMRPLRATFRGFEADPVLVGDLQQPVHVVASRWASGGSHHPVGEHPGAAGLLLRCRSDGNRVANAPHIPVHSARWAPPSEVIRRRLSGMKPVTYTVSTTPAYSGTLPDASQ